MKRYTQRKSSFKQQSGAVLLMGLVLILILSVLVISSAKTTVLQQKMSANLRDKELAFQAAESGLANGEVYLHEKSAEDLATGFTGSAGLYVYDNDRELKAAKDWNTLETIAVTEHHQIAKGAEYIIEELPEIESMGDSMVVPRPVTSEYYRVTAKSTGGSQSSLSIHQSIYKK